MKIALAQFNPTVGDFAGNAARIMSLAGQAKQRGADLAVFTELCLCGYPPQDLLERPGFLDRNMDELKALAGLAVDADLLVIADEVYEHLVFDGRRHLPLANYPGMADRTVTISSAAKMFNCTGWKIGWACGAPDLISGVRAAKQYLTYVGAAPFQPAVAHALNTEEAWVAALRESLQAKRDKLGSALADLGFEVHDSFGTYFLCADPRPLGFDDSTAFCAQLLERAGVAAIPMSAFCDPGADHADAWNHLVRFAFCKRDDTLDEAIRRLSVLQSS